jgi:hypothetical protein
VGTPGRPFHLRLHRASRLLDCRQPFLYRIGEELLVILELEKSLLPGVFSTNRQLNRSVADGSAIGLNPLVQQLVFFEKRVTQSFAFGSYKLPFGNDRPA